MCCYARIVLEIIGCRSDKNQSNFSSLNLLETYCKIAYIFKIKADVSCKLSHNYSCINLIPQSNISCIHGYC